ncbi:MAG TPA: S-methyl-5'-thioadenosine phosphorylase [Caulobacteraceae bacterium]
MSGWTLGVLGGSGLYDVEGLQDVRRETVDTPWGAPSGELVSGELGGVRLVFLPRHGPCHRIPPSEVNARANIHALKAAGCTDVLSLSAVGSLREDLPPRTFVVVDQYVDRTVARPKSFFGEGLVAHVSMADPTCPRLSALAAAAAREAGANVVEGGTYLCIEGPQFSTRAESELYRSWGCDVIGMTNMPEAKLAREAELPYASVCMVTDYDCWRPDCEGVDVSHVIEHLIANTAAAKALLELLAPRLAGERQPSPIDAALEHAIITAPGARDPELAGRLKVVAGRVL